MAGKPTDCTFHGPDCIYPSDSSLYRKCGEDVPGAGPCGWRLTP